MRAPECLWHLRLNGEYIGGIAEFAHPRTYQFKPRHQSDYRFAGIAGHNFDDCVEAAKENASGQAGEINNNQLEFSHATELRKSYHD